MIREIIVVVALIASLSASVAIAHGGKTHVRGTVLSVAAEEIVVKDREGHTRALRLSPDTRYRDAAGAPARAEELRAGDRVVVDLRSKGETADEIRFSHPKGEPEGEHGKSR